MTTSFAHLMRGQVVEAFRANPAALLLAIGCALLIPWCGLSAFYARTCWTYRPGFVAIVFFGSVSAVALIQWFVRVFILSSTFGY